MRMILEAMKPLGIPFEMPLDERCEYSVQSIFMAHDCWTPEVGKAIEILWKNSGIRRAFERSREYQLNDNAAYTFDSIKRFANPE